MAGLINFINSTMTKEALPGFLQELFVAMLWLLAACLVQETQIGRAS